MSGPGRYVLVLLALLHVVALAWGARAVNRDEMSMPRGISGRRLAQETSAFISSQNVSDVQAILDGQPDGGLVLLDFEVLELVDTLTVQHPMTVRGVARPRTTVRCPSGKPALNIRASLVSIEKLKFEGCDFSAVTVEHPDVENGASPPVAVSFSEVEFVDNGVVQGADNTTDPLLQSTPSGGAISAGPKCAIDVEDSQFSGNRAVVGGAVYVQDGSLILTRSVFLENIAQFSGGAVAVERATRLPDGTTPVELSATDCQFSRNSVMTLLDSPNGPSNSQGGPLESSQFKTFSTPTGSGGAVFASNISGVSIQSCDFEANMGGAGGAIYAHDSGDLLLSGSTFERNELIGGEEKRELQQGGAVYALMDIPSHTATVVDCAFTENNAAYGGALHLVTAQDNNVELRGTLFARNRAVLYGGGVVLRNAFTSRWERCQFDGNDAMVGGALLLTNGAGASFESTPINDSFSSSSIFSMNTANFGGALMCLGCGVLQLQAVSFTSNEAAHDGGALGVVKSLTSGAVALSGGKFSDNRARRGGAIYFRGGAQLDLRSSSAESPLTFDANRATSGGAIYMIMGGQVRGFLNVGDVLFTNNMAIATDRNNRRRLLDTQHDAMVAGREGRELNQAATSFLRYVALGNGDIGLCGEGSGSAMCLDLASEPEDFDVEVTFQETMFTNNQAEGKGTLRVSIKGDTFGGDICQNHIPLIESCNSFIMRGTTFTDNVVANGEPTVSTNNPDAIFVSCDAGPTAVPGPLESLADLREGCQRQCPSWTGNTSGSKRR